MKRKEEENTPKSKKSGQEQNTATHSAASEENGKFNTLHQQDFYTGDGWDGKESIIVIVNKPPTAREDKHPDYGDNMSKSAA